MGEVSFCFCGRPLTEKLGDIKVCPRHGVDITKTVRKKIGKWSGASKWRKEHEGRW